MRARPRRLLRSLRCILEQRFEILSARSVMHELRYVGTLLDEASQNVLM